MTTQEIEQAFERDYSDEVAQWEEDVTDVLRELSVKVPREVKLQSLIDFYKNR